MFVITAQEHYIDGNDNKVKIHSFVKFWQIGMKSVTVNVWLSPGFRLHFLFRIHRIVQLRPILLSELKLNLKTQVRFCELAYISHKMLETTNSLSRDTLKAIDFHFDILRNFQISLSKKMCTVFWSKKVNYLGRKSSPENHWLIRILQTCF